MMSRAEKCAGFVNDRVEFLSATQPHNKQPDHSESDTDTKLQISPILTRSIGTRSSAEATQRISDAFDPHNLAEVAGAAWHDEGRHNFASNFEGGAWTTRHHRAADLMTKHCRRRERYFLRTGESLHEHSNRNTRKRRRSHQQKKARLLLDAMQVCVADATRFNLHQYLVCLRHWGKHCLNIHL